MFFANSKTSIIQHISNYEQSTELASKILFTYDPPESDTEISLIKRFSVASHMDDEDPPIQDGQRSSKFLFRFPS
jgi:hypothetical protein